MPDIAVKTLAGADSQTITLSDAVFGAPINVPLMHQAVMRIQNAQRAGSGAAKTRGQVKGSTAKIYRQKGTGRARHGSRKSPIFKGGGVVFPPTPRSFAVRMPKKMRRAATRSALTSRIEDNGILVVDSLVPAEPKTKEMVSALTGLNATGKVLIVDERIDELTERAARNIPGVEFKPASVVNILDVLSHDVLLFSVDGIRQLERLLTDANV
jgi:large subunit ribosomal protein L4